VPKEGVQTCPRRIYLKRITFEGPKAEGKAYPQKAVCPEVRAIPGVVKGGGVPDEKL